MGSIPSLWLFLTLGLISSLLLALGLLMMKSRGEALPLARGKSTLSAIWIWIRDPMWLGGLGVQIAGYALYMVSLAAPISLIAVMMQAGIALFVVLAAILLHERAHPLEWAGIGGIIIAIFLLAWSIESGAAQGATDSKALIVLTVIGIVAAAAPAIDPRLRMNGAAPAIASGIVFGLGGLYTKALADTFSASHLVELIANPWLYLTIVSNVAGLVMLQNAFHQARGIIAMPLSSACSNVVPIVGGMIAFGERLPAGTMAATMRIAAFVITVGASALLATGEEHIAS